MKTIRSTLGGTQFLVQVKDDESMVVVPSGSRANDPSDLERATIPTGITDDLTDAYSEAKELVKNIAEDFGNGLTAFASATAPKRISLEFGLTFSAKAGLWIITGEGEASMKITLEWDRDEQPR
jgi:hypothetical protein